MTPHSISPASRALLAAGLFFGVAAAQAASGFVVTPRQEGLVSPGMSQADVQQTLGRPAHNVQYHKEPGRTWTYSVAGNDNALFDVDFGSDGRVLEANQRMNLVPASHAR